MTPDATPDRTLDRKLDDKATELLALHTGPELLVVVNVWDVASATVVASAPGCRALATASHAIAATFGYPDGERISRDLMLDMCGRIAAAVDLPVTADLEAGYGDPAETTRRAVAAGIAGANLEDAMAPLADSVAAVEAVVRAAAEAGVPFVLNARTDAFLQAGDRNRDQVLADAIERGRAYLDAGAACVFVPGLVDELTVRRLVEGIGARRVSLLATPGTPPLSVLAGLGVARVSFGPWSQRVAMTALADTAADLLAGGSLPDGVRPLT